MTSIALKLILILAPCLLFEAYLRFAHVIQIGLARFASEPVKFFPGNNERLFKYQLLNNFLRDNSSDRCFAIGSSHIAYVKRLAGCKSLFNLGVSGASFEDLRLVSCYLAPYMKTGDTVYYEISPWTFKSEADLRHRQWQNLLQTNLDEDLCREPNGGIIGLGLTAKNYLQGKSIFGVVDLVKFFSFNFSFGLPSSNQSSVAHMNSLGVMIPQSTVYNDSPPTMYKTPYLFNEAHSRSLVRYMQKLHQAGVQLKVLITPHVLDVDQPFDLNLRLQLDQLEQKIKSSALNFVGDGGIYGSYLVENTRCDKEQFLDWNHPRESCVSLLVAD